MRLLLSAKNILLTPHLGASTYEASEGVSFGICRQIRDFLLETNHINKIKKDFKNITFYIPFYKTMINEILHKIIINIKKNNVVVSYMNFKILDEVIKEKIIEKIFYYFQTRNKKLRYSKVKIFVSKLNKKNLKSINISNLIVVKSQNSLVFSINK